MRRRDRIYFSVLGVLVALHAIGLASAVAFEWWTGKRILARIQNVEEALDAEARERADGVAAAIAVRSASNASSSSDTSSDPLPGPTIQGFGQTKSKHARYIYADYRMPDGTVTRQYLQKFPLNIENSLDSHSQN